MSNQGLHVESLVAGHGGTAVVHGIDLTVRPGEVVSLLGPNGAGKTTTLLTIAGALRPLAGRVLLDGNDLTGRPADAVARAGLSLVPEDRGLFRSLTVQEHLDLRSHRRSDPARALELFPALAPLTKRHAGLLSGGEQQMLALATAILANPRVLLIDELSQGLAPIIVQRLVPTLRAVADAGAAVLLVEQHVEAALSISDRVYVLARGNVQLEGPATEWHTDRAALAASYLGGDRTHMTPHGTGGR